MPTAAKQFALGNRTVAKGETFEIPAGEEADFRGKGLIEGEEGDPAEVVSAGAESPPLAGGAVSPEPGAHESASETAARAADAQPAEDKVADTSGK